MARTFSREVNPFVKPGAKPSELADGYAFAMDVFAIRLANLQALAQDLKARGHRFHKDIARELDLGASFFTQLIKGKKMGEDVARKLEQSAGLAFGYMDVVHPHVTYPGGPENNSGLTSHQLRIDPEILTQSIRLVRLTFENLGIPFDAEKDGRMIAHAYEYLSAAQQATVTAENLIDFSKKLSEKMKESGNEESGTGHSGEARSGARRAS